MQLQFIFPVTLTLLAASCTTSTSSSLDNAAEVTTTAAVAKPPAESSNSPVSFDLSFITHLDKELPEQDVFIEREAGSDEVWRVTLGDHDMNQPLFKTNVRVPHNPFDVAALGPHPKGEALGMTLGQWLRHAGQRTLHLQFNGSGHGSRPRVQQVSFPNGVYTMWHAFMALPPTQPFSGDARPSARRPRRAPTSAFTGRLAAAMLAFEHELLPRASRCPTSGPRRCWRSTTTATTRPTGADPGAFGLQRPHPACS